jgi:hypothetical protein
MLGTRIWYAFWDGDQDDDDAFERQVDDLDSVHAENRALLWTSPQR